MNNDDRRRLKKTTPARPERGTATRNNKKSLRPAAARGEVVALTNQGDAIAVAKRMLAQATGVKDLDLAVRVIEQVSRIQTLWPSGNAAEPFQAATEMMLEIKPESLSEALLAVQMIGVHHAALSCLQQTALQINSPEGRDVGVRTTMRLMRLYVEQLEAMSKLKGKTGRQKVTVEHVHVYQGGQAIVGAVSAAPKAEGEGGNEKRRKKTP